MRRPLFGNGFPVQVNPGEEVVLFDAAEGQTPSTQGHIYFVTAYYYFTPETTGDGVNAQVFQDSGPGTPQILLEDIDNTIALGLFLVDKGAMLAVDRIPVSGTQRLIVKGEVTGETSDQAFWVMGYFEVDSPDRDESQISRPLQPNKNQVTTDPCQISVATSPANDTVITKTLHELTTEYVDEITLFVGLTKDPDAEPAEPIPVVIQ